MDQLNDTYNQILKKIDENNNHTLILYGNFNRNIIHDKLCKENIAVSISYGYNDMLKLLNNIKLKQKENYKEKPNYIFETEYMKMFGSYLNVKKYLIIESYYEKFDEEIIFTIIQLQKFNLGKFIIITEHFNSYDSYIYICKICDNDINLQDKRCINCKRKNDSYIDTECLAFKIYKNLLSTNTKQYFLNDLLQLTI
jgi:hypothetical protein